MTPEMSNYRQRFRCISIYVEPAERDRIEAAARAAAEVAGVARVSLAAWCLGQIRKALREREDD